MFKNIPLSALVCGTILAINLQGSDAKQEIAAFQYIKNLAEKKSMIFEDTFVIDALQRRLNDTNFWVQTNLKKHADSTVEKAFTRISSNATLIYNDILMISNNLESIKTDSKSLNNFRNVALNFSKARDLLKEELDPKGKLQSVKKRYFPPVNDAKKDIIMVLLAYAETFARVAQKAINDFAILDKDLFLQEKNPLKRNMIQESTQDSSVLMNKPTIDTLYTEFIEEEPSMPSKMQIESMEYNIEQVKNTQQAEEPFESKSFEDPLREAPLILPALRD